MYKRQEDNNAGWTESAAAPSEGGGTVDFAAVRQNAKLILSADLTLETQSFDQAGADIEALAAGAGGYIEASSVSGELGGRYASYTPVSYTHLSHHQCSFWFYFSYTYL